MKAKDRKWMLSTLERLAYDPEVQKLQQEYKRKGFLSRREMKILENQASKTEAA